MDWLYQELAITPPSEFDGIEESDPFAPSSSTLKVPPSRTSAIDADPFTSSTSTPTPCPRGKRSGSSLLTKDIDDDSEANESLPTYRRIYANFIARMDELEAEGKDLDAHAHLGLQGVDPTPGLLAWAHETVTALSDTKTRRETYIQALYDQLEGLWRRLGVADDDIDEFVERWRGTGEESVKAYEEECERMCEVRAKSLGVFVGNARDEIEALWEELMVGDMERREFTAFSDGEAPSFLLHSASCVESFGHRRIHGRSPDDA
jgi:Ase1/PRC1/MAP65 family protein